MLMRRRGVHSGLVVKVLQLSRHFDLEIYHEFLILIVLFYEMSDQEVYSSLITNSG